MVTELDLYFDQSSSFQTGIAAVHRLELTGLFVIIIE